MDTALRPIFTDEGRRHLLEGIGSSKNYRITHVQVGSGDSSGDSNNGYGPTPEMTALKAPVQSAKATGEVTPDGKRVHVAAVVGPPTAKEEQATPGITRDEYQIYEIGFFITDVTGDVANGEPILFAIYAREPDTGPLLSKTPTTDLLLGFDLLLPDLPEDHTIEIAEDAYFKFPLSTETQPGVLRLATPGEATAGSNGEKAITPATLKRAHSLASADGTDESALSVDAAGRVGIGTTTPTARLHVNGRIKDETGDVMPVGGIIMWSGPVNDIPAGWALCDGNNETPDLRGRFVLGSGQGAGLSRRTPNEKNGEENHVLKVNEMPGHTHSTGSSGAHSHQYTIFKGNDTNWSSKHGGPYTLGTDDNRDNAKTDRRTKRSGSHTHGVASTGGGRAHNNMPPYYVLAYIMKL